MLALLSIYTRATSQTEVAKQIRHLEQLSVEAILKSDTAMLKKIWAPEFMVNTPRNDVAGDRKEVLRIQKAGLINYKSFERIIEKIQVHDQVVITVGYEKFVPNDDLPEAGQEIKRRFMNVWMKQQGEWKHVARQASIICP